MSHEHNRHLLGLLVCLLCAALCGCAYKGGKIVDGSNIAIGITIPGTEWTINALDYVGGLRVAGNDATSITVTNEVNETNSYFGVITTKRHTKMSAKIEPVESTPANEDAENASPSSSFAQPPEAGITPV